jgi:hypothetical protein
MRAIDLARALKAVRSGRQWKCRCVAHEDSEPSMIFFDGREDGRVQVRCMAGCEPEDIIAELKRRGLWDDKSLAEVNRERRRQEQIEEEKKAHRLRVLARGIFDEAKPIKGSLAETYFESRNIADTARMIDDIRYHYACPRGSITQPAVIIAMRSVVTTAITAIQRIFLTRNGCKDGKGMMLGQVGGAAMMLQRLQNAKLQVCEGLETGLSIIEMYPEYGPVWALGSTANMQSFAVIDSVKTLTIRADNDEAGLKAAELCKARWHVSAGKVIEIYKPKVGARDYNDIWSVRCARLG